MTRITATPENLASLSGGSGAPTTASYVVIGGNASLSAERVLTAGTGISIADGGANNTVTVSVAAGTYAAASHTHTASDITSGVLATARLANSGTASSTTWLRGDQTWSTLGTASGSVATKWTKLCADGAYRVDGGPHVASVAKTSDTTLSTTGLTMSGLATGRYDLVIRLVYTGNATARIKLQLVATNCTIRWRTTDRDTGTQTNTESSVMDYPASASEQMLIIEGIVNVTSSTGTVDLHMAQLVSNATATNIAQGTMHLSEKAA